MQPRTSGKAGLTWLSLQDQAQENKLQLVVQKLVDIKQRLDSLPPASSQTRQRKRQVISS